MFQISQVTPFLPGICLISLKFYSLSKWKISFLKKCCFKRDFKFHWSQEINKCSPQFCLAATTVKSPPPPPAWMTSCSSGSRCSPSLTLPKAQLPHDQPNSGLLDFPHASENQGLILTVVAVNTCIISLLLSTDDLLPSLTRGRRWRQQPQSQCVSRQCVTEAEGIGTTLILPEQDSQYFITVSNSSVKPFPTAESETPELSKRNWKNTPLFKGLIDGLS